MFETTWHRTTDRYGRREATVNIHAQHNCILSHRQKYSQAEQGTVKYSAHAAHATPGCEWRWRPCLRAESLAVETLENNAPKRINLGINGDTMSRHLTCHIWFSAVATTRDMTDSQTNTLFD